MKSGRRGLLSGAKDAIEGKTEMSEISIQGTAQEELILSVLRDLRNGQIDDATGRFAKEFRFIDHGIGLEFKDKERLAEFYQKTRQLYPDSVLQTDAIFPSRDRVITEWTLQTMLAEPFTGGIKLRVPISLCGTSIVRTENGMITDWAD
jgi:SnoaL-like domain